MTYTCITLASPVGELKLVANGSRLAAILWENDKPGRVRLGPMSEAPDNPILRAHARDSCANISPARASRFELELDFVGTEFQKKVWAALLTIPFGETRSYSQIAEADRQPERGPGGGCGEWRESDFDRGAVSSGDWRVGEADRVCRGAGGEGERCSPWKAETPRLPGF